MANAAWYIRRLRAMSPREVLWRLSQKRLERRERAAFLSPRRVDKEGFTPDLSSLQPDAARFHLTESNPFASARTDIHLLGGASYAAYKTCWRAGFQTGAEWPSTFSPDLAYKQRDDIGDARTSWELSRHFQFALLAKDFYLTREDRFLEELRALFEDWNLTFPFLHGIAWTSVMEVAIRAINWAYALAFLSMAGEGGELAEGLRRGILNMTRYVEAHRSRFSSANNHLIVEACALGHSGILFGHAPWVDLAVSILTEELPRQNFPDGVNREVSLHYQAFYLEAMGLMMRLLKTNGLPVPASWAPGLLSMCRYVGDCLGDFGEAVVFGDDDEGKILDLDGISLPEVLPPADAPYRRVLGLCSLVLGTPLTDLSALTEETLHWLFPQADFDAVINSAPARPELVSSYREGGVTLLRSRDRRVFLGVDHGPLGFGSLCAHGHADALSFQLFFMGHPVLIDPGTYIYHCDLPSRNEFRRTRSHNTVCVGGADQSEMLGAFLWGRQARAQLKKLQEEDGHVRLSMSQDGYAPVIHERTLSFDGERTLRVEDALSREAPAQAVFVLSPDIQAALSGSTLALTGPGFTARMTFSEGGAQLVPCSCSFHYGQREATSKVVVPFSHSLTTTLELQDS